MSFVELVAATPDHIAPVAERMREWDRIEAGAFGYSSAVALRMGLAGSVDCFTALVDGTPEAIMGLMPKSLVAAEGSPWLLGTEVVYANPRAMLALGPKVVALWSDSTPNMAGLVAAGNDRAIRYLRRIGFTIGEEPTMTGGVDFVTFTMERR
jgi:hypothetical protein